MADAISVPAGFRESFELMCARSKMGAREKLSFRNMIRDNFAELGPWVQETAAVYRFCDETWNGLPPAGYCETYLISKGVFPADLSIFKRWGILLLARECAIAAGALDAVPAIQ